MTKDKRKAQVRAFSFTGPYCCFYCDRDLFSLIRRINKTERDRVQMSSSAAAAHLSSGDGANSRST